MDQIQKKLNRMNDKSIYYMKKLAKVNDVPERLRPAYLLSIELEYYLEERKKK